MDKPHQEVAAERYDMLVRHVLNAPMAGHTLKFFLFDQTEDHFVFEVGCTVCDWWDHWDERKSDWNAT